MLLKLFIQNIFTFGFNLLRRSDLHLYTSGIKYWNTKYIVWDINLTFVSPDKKKATDYYWNQILRASEKKEFMLQKNIQQHLT